MGLYLRLTEFHEDVDVPGGFGEVDKPDDVRVVYLVSYFYFSPYPLYYVYF
jgi:hypothetical protein